LSLNLKEFVMVAAEQSSRRSDFNSMAADVECRTTELIKENPGLSMLIVFGVGIGVGALLGEALPLASMVKTPESTFERVGRQLLETLNIKL
jgi:hypothetical protein